MNRVKVRVLSKSSEWEFRVVNGGRVRVVDRVKVVDRCSSRVVIEGIVRVINRGRFRVIIRPCSWVAL